MTLDSDPMTSTRIPILMYHGVGETSSPVSITADRFAAQMAWLHRAEINVVPLLEIVERIRSREPLPDRSVSITFDDGLESVYTQAWPVLARYGFPATVFLVAGRCGLDNAWPGQPAGIHRESLLSWEQVQELHRHGIQIGAHTLDHPRLDLLPQEEAKRQIVDSKAIIEEQLGHPVRLFAYPYGRHTPTARQIVSSLYSGACTARPGLVSMSSKAWTLGRIDIAYVNHLFLFRRLFSPMFPEYLGFRRKLRRLGSRWLRRAWA